MFPVYVMTEGVELPKEGTFYVVAKDGLYIHKDTGLIRALVKVDRVSFLGAVLPRASLLLPMIPAEEAAKIINFFRVVFKKHKSEAIVLLFWNKEAGLWKVAAPKQTVAAASLDYDKALRIPEHLLVGSVHSHANMSAFHSGVDHRDEANFDGLHITLGNLDLDHHTYSSEVVVNNNRFSVVPSTYIGGLIPVQEDVAKLLDLRQKPRRAIFDKVVEQITFGDVFDLPDLCFETEKPKKTTPYHDIALPVGTSLADYPFPEEWLEIVEEKKLPVSPSWINKSPVFSLLGTKPILEPNQESEQTLDLRTDIGPAAQGDKECASK